MSKLDAEIENLRKITPRTKQYYEAARYCQKQLTHLRFYIEQGIDADKEVGVAAALLSSYRAQRGRKSSFMIWMSTFAMQLKKCRAALEATGAPGVCIDRFLARVEVLQEAGADQEQMKRRRTQKARDRVNAKNRLYTALKQVERLAAIVYEQEDGSMQDEYYFFKLPAYRRKPKAQVQEEAGEEQAAAAYAETQETAPAVPTTGHPPAGGSPSGTSAIGPQYPLPRAHNNKDHHVGPKRPSS